ncbi:hypothetical protein [Phenylobacterium immobile]|uniref:hypothetical protein n=1 Tax=Phenylobacterium immobile TaxID=21 RepID=UPI000B017225|nr:hypothetical protein [Phenylobacterium immobile]
MGALLKALSGTSSYGAKKADLWADLKDRVDGAILPADLDEFERWLDARPLDYPAAYREPLDELIAVRRLELAEEDGQDDLQLPDRYRLRPRP